MIGARSSATVDDCPVALCPNEEEDRCLPNASGHEVSLDAGSLFLERSELPSFHGLAGQCFSGVIGVAVFLLEACTESPTLGANLVDECSWVFVGKKSVVSMLEKLGLRDDARW
jgi:hypothetical protein